MLSTMGIKESINRSFEIEVRVYYLKGESSMLFFSTEDKKKASLYEKKHPSSKTNSSSLIDIYNRIV